MRRRSSLLWVGLAAVAALIFPCQAFAQHPSAVPVDLEVPFAPIPVKADGKLHLVYELHVTNFKAKTLELSRVEVLGPEENGPPLARYGDADLAGVLARPGTAASAADKRSIAGGTRAVVFVWLSFDSEKEVPASLRHRLFFKPDVPGGKESVVEGGAVPVREYPPLVIGPPLRGERWVALNGPSNTSDHRRTLVVVDGRARIAQRYATDWTRIGDNGLAFHGDPADNKNWAAYGAAVLAVADGTVVDAKDGIPENDPTADKKAVPITLETVGGNYLILDLGGGRFAFYAHLQPASLRFKIGDHVKRGQVIALLGNSGNSDAPHLHFHVTDGNSPLGAEGVPYSFDTFRVLGSLTSEKLLIEGGWHPPKQPPSPSVRVGELPTENAVVAFP